MKRSWKKVEEYSPDTSKEILCYSKGEYMVGYANSYLLSWECVSDDQVLENITHWQELIPPKNEKNN